jgi:hypothetical protein
MRILIRRIHVHPSMARWRLFESILRDCLTRLDHDVFEMDIDFFLPELPPDPPEAEYRIYAHKTRRDAPTANLFYKEMYIHHLFTVDTEGWGIEHSRMKQPPDLSGMDPDEAERFCTALSTQLLTSGHSKVQQPPPQPVDSALKPYLLAPMQIPTDYTVRTHAPLTVEQYVDGIADWAESRRQRVAFKVHPGREFPELTKAAHRRADGSRYVVVVSGNIHSLISESEGVIVFNSGTGFESLIHGKPVITLGNCDYQWVTHRCRIDQLDSAVQYAATYSDEQRRQAYRFVHHYYRDHGFLIQPDPEPVRQRLTEYLKSVLPA